LHPKGPEKCQKISKNVKKSPKIYDATFIYAVLYSENGLRARKPVQQ